MSYPHGLQRFVDAQASVFAVAMEELAAGRKRSHWMWFVFPQLRGLGMSAMAQAYGLASLDEAKAYLAHPVLGPRLRVAVDKVQAGPGVSLQAIFGSPDDLKFRSCITLFDAAAPGEAFKAALARWCGGQPDPRTLELLRAQSMTR